MRRLFLPLGMAQGSQASRWRRRYGGSRLRVGVRLVEFAEDSLTVKAEAHVHLGGLCLGHQDLIVHRGAVKLPDGEFVDLPVADRARRLLELAGLRPASANCDDILTDFLACNLRQFPPARGLPSRHCCGCGPVG